MPHLTKQEWKLILPFMRAGEPVQLRGRPTQQRSVATFQLILDTAARLLESRGFDALTTNLLAEESGLSVRAIYRYFPNKHAVVAELAAQMAVRWRDAVSGAGPFDDPSRAWDELWAQYIDAFVGAVRSTPGARAVLAAMREDPTLRAVDEAANRGYIDGITAALISRRPSIGRPEASTVATVLMRSTVAVLDEAFEADLRTARRLVAVLVRMHLGLLREVLGDPEPRRRANARTRR